MRGKADLLLAAEARDADDTREERRVSGVIARARGAPAIVLVADDDEATRSALRELLLAEGYDVMDAADGAQAIEVLARAADGNGPRPDVVLLDFVMPGLSGVGILRVMRRFPSMPPTVIMTGFPDRSVETFARTFGAVRILRKPIDEDELRRVVLESALHGRASNGG
jgi:CheY-like chemotaxis protein